MDALVWIVVIAIGIGGVWYGGRRAARSAREDPPKR